MYEITESANDTANDQQDIGVLTNVHFLYFVCLIHIISEVTIFIRI
jgi:hypothetical protein